MNCEIICKIEDKIIQKEDISTQNNGYILFGYVDNVCKFCLELEVKRNTYSIVFTCIKIGAGS